MGLRINTNVPALVSQRNLRMTRSNLDRSFERLSSGFRINHAGDDAAGLAISETPSRTVKRNWTSRTKRPRWNFCCTSC